jgi:hypothetical protein
MSGEASHSWPPFGRRIGSSENCCAAAQVIAFHKAVLTTNQSAHLLFGFCPFVSINDLRVVSSD